MNIYTHRNKLKLLLSLVGIVIVSLSLWFTNSLVTKIRINERNNVELWAKSVEKKAQLVSSTDSLFQILKSEERKRAALLGRAYQNISGNTDGIDFDFSLDILKENTTIPIIITDRKKKILNSANLPFSIDSITYLRGRLLREFSEYDPITLDYIGNEKFYLHYQNSIIYSRIQEIVDDLNTSFLEEIVLNSASVPVIVTDSSMKNILQYGNIDEKRIGDTLASRFLIEEMEGQNDPIVIDLPQSGKHFIFYKDSQLQAQLTYFPILIFLAMSVFILLGYLTFSTSRKAEQNQVWAGLAKETAHQLGTPLSSMIAWVDLLRMQGVDEDSLNELEKDVHRLEVITTRFSKIGSVPKLKLNDVGEIVKDFIDYFKTRTSKNIQYDLNITPNDGSKVVAPINESLFGWVIENLCKNAVDAMEGNGKISITISEDNQFVFVDVSDTGKGIPNNHFKSIFKPGFTTKKRGWGLGLSLADRIIRNYHKGKIFVKKSSPGLGSTFRVQLKKSKSLQ
jgi:signal transduction histidine kinase